MLRVRYMPASVLAALTAVAALHLAAPSARSGERSSVVHALSGHAVVIGRVIMSDTRDPLRGAEVWVEGSTRARAWSDSAGRFSLDVKDGDTLWLRARRVGFYPVRGPIMDHADSVITVELGMDPMLLCLDCTEPAKPTPGYVHVIR